MTGHTVRFQFAARRPSPAPPPPRPSRAARMLALAHHIEDLVERGVLRDYADAARRLGLTRARMSQVMDLLMLAPEIQEGIVTGELRVTERGLRRVAQTDQWNHQGHSWPNRRDHHMRDDRGRSSIST